MSLRRTTKGEAKRGSRSRIDGVMCPFNGRAEKGTVENKNPF